MIKEETYHMTKDELASMRKGQQINARQTRGEDDVSLHLSEAETRWWTDAKLGLFVHFGVYAIIGKGEWVYHNDHMHEDDYRRLAMAWTPKRTGESIANEWLDAAQSSGMKYAVMVTRHHDGYALWDSKSSYADFTSTTTGPRTDYVKHFIDACRARDIKIGLYYSPMDWRFPGYFDPEGQPESAQAMKAQAYNQLRELCTQYGNVDIVWYDGAWLAHRGSDADAAWFWEPIKLNKMVRAYQPGVLVTPRSGYTGDFACDEGPHEVTGDIRDYLWEKCMSVTSSWCYRPNDKCHSPAFLINTLVNTVCRGGNLLLNAGPDADGHIPQKVKEALAEVGKWMQENGESIYGTRGGIWQPVQYIYGSTYKDNLVYLHIQHCEYFARTVLPSIESKIKQVTLLTGEDIPYCQNDRGITIDIPERVKQEKRIDTIVKITL